MFSRMQYVISGCPIPISNFSYRSACWAQDELERTCAASEDFVDTDFYLGAPFLVGILVFAVERL